MNSHASLEEVDFTDNAAWLECIKYTSTVHLAVLSMTPGPVQLSSV
jgi:hypothetical protein